MKTRSIKADRKGKVEVELNPEQAEVLGIGHDVELLGCGQMACAYGVSADRVVKLTKDTRDAMASYILSNLPQAGRGWAIPIKAVYRLEKPKNYFAIVAERAEPIPRDLAEAIDWIYELAGQHKRTVLHDWPEFIEIACEEISDHPQREELTATLAIIDRAVQGFHRLGLEWVDFHSGNFGIYDGDVVVIDLGLSFPADMPPAETLDQVGVERL